MRKKYLSALLFGALLFASAGTFTSCKDYDDDINNLTQRVETIESTLNSLQSQIEGGAVITNVETTANGIQITLSNDQTYELTNGSDGAAGSVVTIDGEGYWCIDGERTEYKAQGTDGADGEDGKYYVPGENGYWIEVTPNADGTTTETETTISWTPSGTVTAVWDSENGNLLLSNVEGHDGVLTISLTNSLKSLVFQPDFYYQGIEAIAAYTYNYNSLTINTVDADGNYGTDAPENGDAASVTPGLVAKYHMNPSSADWKSIQSLTYITDDKEYTRASAVAATVKSWDAENGILTVHSQLTGGSIKDIEQDGKVTVLALQANYSKNGQDTIITSDYAALKAKDTYITALADTGNIELSHPRHLFTTAAEAIADTVYSHEIMWNSDGIDVATLVQTHVSDQQQGGTESNWDKNAADGTVEDYGFKYSFELVGYHVGQNSTSESAHAVMNGSVLKPCMPVDGKQPSWDNATQNRAETGREPLVRVVLTDTISNQIAAVGYMKFKIVDQETVNESTVIYDVEFPFTTGYTVDCSETEQTLRIEWHDFEEDILAQLESLGISKEEFHSDFTLDGGEADATQYDGILATSTATTKKGTISQTTTDTGAEQTEILEWKLANNEAYQLFKNNASISANIRYSKEVTAGSGVYQYVYVTLTWTPNPRNVAPAGTLADADKISQYWYAQNSGTPGSGYSDIHANVETVGQTNADDEFKSDILNTFVGNDVTVSDIDAVYTAFTDAQLSKYFTFVDPQGTDLTPVTGNSGTQYDITVGDNGKTLYANVVGSTVKQAVVKINGSVLEYQGQDDETKYAYARDILNYADHNQLGIKQTFTAQLQVTAENCDYVPFDLSNNTFYAKFLRPITISDPHETNFVDAETGGARSDLKLTFTDWRDHDFDNETQTQGHNYYAYYNVKEITCLEDEIRTDLNGTSGTFDRLLSAVTNNIKFKFEEPSTTDIQESQDFGTLVYENNGTTVGDFQIQVPFDVVYDWGTIRVNVICKISQTENN